MIFPGGVTLAEVGSDHLRLNDHIDVAGVALAVTVINWLESDAHQMVNGVESHDQMSPAPQD
jgi:hypothetical protein